ncbi:hypothetical protein E0H88_14475 [Acinetobacter sp. ANC 4216]|uniref:hypothetical protein n=1 Tax=Acinetobacter sp. ANC 4216 TaxID=2529840 RepID=UPI0010395A14|nr:hypothetical protein [Acinetobacter sp. ANC 4216]TCB64857.1 hypothetical protein E0H88_14475 [Acinetobacter sp. ANC 4216]
MKIKILIALTITLSGCAYFPQYQTPYNIPKVTIQGTNWQEGSMLTSTHRRYWLSYERAIEAEGYKTNRTNLILTENNKPGDFKTIDYHIPQNDNTSQRQKLNKQLFIEGSIYAKSLCTAYFQNASFTKAHRENLRRQSNITGGLISAALGLAEASVGAISGVGVAFSSLDSSFDAYNTSFLVSPNLGLVERSVMRQLDTISQKYKNTEFNYVADTLTALAEYDLSCSQNGMQALVDDALNKQITNYTSSTITGSQLAEAAVTEAQKIENATQKENKP